jgi:hypothetical protein
MRYKSGQTHPSRKSPQMTRIGYARCSTDKQDLEAQRTALLDLGVAVDRVCTDNGLSGTDRARPGLAVRGSPRRAGQGGRRVSATACAFDSSGCRR